MWRKIAIVSGLGVLLSILVPAQTAPPTFAELLGTLDGTVNFCTKVNPKSAAKYKEMVQLVTNGHSDELIAEIREGKEYKDTVDQISKKLGAITERSFSDLQSSREVRAVDRGH